LSKPILYLHGRPCSHFLHNSLANSLGVDAKFIDEKYRWQDQGFGIIKNCYAWFMNALAYKKHASYNYILIDGLHFSPVLAKKMGILPKHIKLISHMGNQLPYFMLANKLSKYSIYCHKWLFNNYDYILCEGSLIKEMILTVNPKIKSKLLLTFLGPLTARVDGLRKIKPDFESYNLVTIASGPSQARIYYKGLDIMIDAVVKAKAYLPALRYYILGEWSKEDIASLSRKYTAEAFESVFFVGNTNEIERYLKEAALSIHVARGDAFPTSTIEAMHAGLPVIVSNYTGTKEIIKKTEENLIAQLTTDSLVEKIRWYFDLSLAQKNELSEKLKHVSLFYTEENARKHYKELFENNIRNENDSI
jgi:glycosyltransferase involved in cell wall biosynthesis